MELLYALNNAIATAFAAPHHRIFSLVPDAVARVDWAWPRLLNPITLNYNAATAPTAQVHDNLTVSAAPYSPSPPTADWDDTNGQLIRRLTSPNANNAQFGAGRSQGATYGVQVTASDSERSARGQQTVIW